MIALLAALAFGSDIPRPEVAMVVAMADPAVTQCTAEELMRSNELDAIDLLDAATATPPIGSLSGYGAVLVFADIAFDDPVALGDTLADLSRAVAASSWRSGRSAKAPRRSPAVS